MTRGPGESRGAAHKDEKTPGPWRVAKVRSGFGIAEDPRTPQIGTGEDIIGARDPLITLGRGAADDREVTLSVPGSWPRIFPGL